MTVQYTETGSLLVSSVVLAAQHEENVENGALRGTLVEEVILPGPVTVWSRPWPEIHINPTERFVNGRPIAGTGLTGRKIIVDCYGSAAPHGGGAFPGKDPSKIPIGSGREFIKS